MFGAYSICFSGTPFLIDLHKDRKLARCFAGESDAQRFRPTKSERSEGWEHVAQWVR